MKKRLLSLILAIVVVVSALPSVGFGASKPKLTLKVKALPDARVQLTWNKVKKAKKYVVYASKTGTKAKKIATIKANKRKYIVKKINKKNLVSGKKYQFYIVAYSSKGKIAKSSTKKIIAKKIKNPTTDSKTKGETSSDADSESESQNNSSPEANPTPGNPPNPPISPLEQAKANAIARISSEASVYGQEAMNSVSTLLNTATSLIQQATTVEEVSKILDEQLDLIIYQIEKINIGDYLPIGGRIFYVNKQIDNGLTYKFYGANKEEISAGAWSVDASGNPIGLENARFYKVEGVKTSSEDAFFVYANRKSVSKYGGIYKYTDDKNHTCDGVEWGGRGTLIGATYTGIGQGKVNSKIALSADASYIAYTVDEGYETMWTWLNRMNNEEVNLCSDWYIGTTEELKLLLNSTTPGAEVFKDYKIWTSEEVSASMAITWINTTKIWTSNFKSTGWGMNVPAGVVAIRSF